MKSRHVNSEHHPINIILSTLCPFYNKLYMVNIDCVYNYIKYYIKFKLSIFLLPQLNVNYCKINLKFTNNLHTHTQENFWKGKLCKLMNVRDKFFLLNSSLNVFLRIVRYFWVYFIIIFKGDLNHLNSKESYWWKIRN